MTIFLLPMNNAAVRPHLLHIASGPVFLPLKRGYPQSGFSRTVQKVTGVTHAIWFITFFAASNLSHFIATPPNRGWQRNEGPHSFLFLAYLVAFSILRLGMSAKRVSWVVLTQCKRRRVLLLCLLGTSCEVSPSAATGGTSECAGAFWGRKN